MVKEFPFVKANYGISEHLVIRIKKYEKVPKVIQGLSKSLFCVNIPHQSLFPDVYPVTPPGMDTHKHQLLCSLPNADLFKHG